MSEEQVEDSFSGQRSGPCTIINCEKLGRSVGIFAGTHLIYCPRHRKYGQEVISTFLEDVLNYKKNSLYDMAKQELIFGGEKILDDENEKKLGSWIKKEIFQRYLREIGSEEIELFERREEIIRINTGSDESATESLERRETIATDQT